MKIIAFYLPQFHEIPENNEWWGEGFTEWTNTKKAQPLFKNHYQPREPLGDNYYDLNEEHNMKWQVDLAKEYGIHGFCFYHYWFKDGKKLLEKPIEKYLKNKEIDLPYCLSWANEPWSRRWDGSEHQILMQQEYGEKQEWKKHFEYLLPFFKDNRYITNDDKPLFLIYKPELIPNLNDMLDYWQGLANLNGLKGISFAYQHPLFQFMKNKDDSRFDFAIEFEPLYSLARGKYQEKKLVSFKNLLKRQSISKSLISDYIKKAINKILDWKFKKLIIYRFKVTTIFDYDHIAKKSITNIPISDKSIPGVFTDWDNTARRGRNATLFKGSTPEKFKKYLNEKIKRTKNIYKKDMIFINAWNEWAEGAYLEPDKKYKYSYLNAVKEALQENKFK